MKVKYIPAKKGLFLDKNIPKLSSQSLHSLIHKLIYVRLDEEPLAVKHIPEVQMMYFHMHGFPNMDKQLYKVV